MLRGQSKQIGERATSWSLMVFSIGGRMLAARTEDVGGVRPWTGAMQVPSRTPYVNALMRNGEDVLPVFDLAGMLNLRVQGGTPMCLIAKRQDGPMAICIDANIPKLMTVESTALYPPAQPDPNILWQCQIDGITMPIYAFSNLATPPVATS
jgi:chemotaxis signal transduction protein